MERPKTRQIITSILALTFARLMINIGRRFPYPFLPALSRQMSVPLSSVQNVVAAYAGVGIASPLFGPLSEQYGRKRMLLSTLVLMTGASLFGALLPQFAVFAGVMLAFSVAKMIFDPAMWAYLGDIIPYRRRGAVLGFTELAWAGALIIAAPTAGLLLGASGSVLAAEALLESVHASPINGLLRDSSGLQRIFLALTGANLLALLGVWLYVPSDAPHQTITSRIITPLTSWRILRRYPAGLGALVFSLLFAMANEMFFINYGAWMEISFELVLAALGAVTVVIAIAEVTGEFLVIGIADRLGKRRLTLIGTGISSLIYVLMPGLTFSLPVALVGLFVLFVFVETAIVASIPLFTEVIPDARAVMMSSNAGAHALGRLTGAMFGGLVYSVTGSFVVVGILAAGIGLGALIALWWMVHE